MSFMLEVILSFSILMPHMTHTRLAWKQVLWLAFSIINVDSIRFLNDHIFHDSDKPKLSFVGVPDNSSTWSRKAPIRVIIHGYNPNENTSNDDKGGKLVLVPDSIEELFRLAGNPNLLRVSHNLMLISQIIPKSIYICIHTHQKSS